MAPTVPLMLLHPYPTDATFWDRMRRDLDPDRPIMAPDAPGFGDQPPEAGWSIDDIADRVAQQIRTHTATGTADVMGLSMGGYIALALAARHPAQCARLILADTGADADDHATRTARGDAIAAIRAGHRDAYLAGLLPRLLGPDAPREIRGELAQMATRQSSDGLVGALRALASRPDRRADLPALEMPTLVIVGTADPITPPDAARALADNIPNSRLYEIPNVGHLTALECPDIVARAVETFLAHPRRSP